LRFAYTVTAAQLKKRSLTSKTRTTLTGVAAPNEAHDGTPSRDRQVRRCEINAH